MLKWLKTVLTGSAPDAGDTPDPEAGDAIDAFWGFWAQHESAILQAIDDGSLSDWIDAVSDAVAAIDPGLDWEFGEGTRAKHYFCISGGGDMDLRLLAERWLTRGPGPNADFEFVPAKPATGIVSMSMDVHGTTLPLDEVRLSATQTSWRLELDVEVYHPKWGDLPEDARGTAGFVFLDSTLGEDGVERWLGGIRFVTELPDDAITLAELKAKVRELAEQDPWVVLEGQDEAGNRIVSTVRRELKRVDHLGLDAHVEVRIPFGATRDDGLCDDVEADELNAQEDELLELLGADALYVGRRTFDGQRILHLRASGQGPVASRADDWARSQPQDIDVVSTLDPMWKSMPW